MWIILEWVDAKFADDGIHGAIGPFDSLEEANAVVDQYRNGEIVELQPPKAAGKLPEC